MFIKVSEIQSVKGKNVKLLAIILSIFDGYKIICKNHNKHFDVHMNWLIYILEMISNEKKLIINSKIFIDIDLDFLSDMLYYLSLITEFEVRLNLSIEENVINLNYIFNKEYTDLPKFVANCENFEFSNSFNKSLKTKLNAPTFNIMLGKTSNNENDFICEDNINNHDNNELDSKFGILKNLRLTYNFLDDNYFFILFKTLENSLNNLREIEISNNNVTEAIFPILNEVFSDKNNNCLQILLLNNNCIGGQDLEIYLLEFLKMKYIKKIDLSYNCLNNEFLLNLDTYFNNYFYNSNNKSILNNNQYNSNLYQANSVGGNSQSLLNDNIQLNNFKNTNKLENKVYFIFSKNKFEDEYKNETFSKTFINEYKPNERCENLRLNNNEIKQESNLFYTVKHFLENTSKFKNKISFIFDPTFLKESKNLLLKDANEVIQSIKIDASNISNNTNFPSFTSGNIIYNKVCKKELLIEEKCTDLMSNLKFGLNNLENNDDFENFLKNKSLNKDTNARKKNLKILYCNVNNQEDHIQLAKNYDINKYSRIPLMEMDNYIKDENLLLLNGQKSLMDLFQEINEFLFLSDYFFDEKLNNISYDTIFNNSHIIKNESINILNNLTIDKKHNDFFFQSFYEKIEKNFIEIERERKIQKANINRTDALSTISNNNLNINLNLNNLLFLNKSYFSKKNIEYLLKKHFNKELDKFHPNANIYDLYIFFLRFKELNNANAFDNCSFQRNQKIKLPTLSINKFLKRIKINCIFALKFTDYNSIQILSRLSDYFNLNLTYRVKTEKKNLKAKSRIINEGLKSILNFRGYSDNSYKDQYYLHAINNFLDIFLMYADEINLKNDLVTICKYIKFKRNFLINENLNKLYKIALREDDLISKTGKMIDSDFDPYNNKYYNQFRDRDPSLLRIPSDIKHKFLAFHPIHLNYVKLVDLKYETIKKDLVTIAKVAHEDHSYGIRNIYDRIHFLLCKCK